MSDAIISIHVGGCGIRIGDSAWELFCLEHGIRPDGTLVNENENAFLERFFHHNHANQYLPRAVFVDAAYDDLIKLRASRYCSTDFVTGNSTDGLNYFASGYKHHELAELCLDRVRKVAEQCDSLQGFLLYHSVCHGTGSGLGSYLLKKLKKIYKAQSIIAITNMPQSEKSNGYWEAVNTGLSIRYLTEHADMVIPYQNHLLQNSVEYVGIDANDTNRVNKYVAQVISSFTSTLRFEEPVMDYQGVVGCFDPFLNRKLRDFRHNLIHYDLNFATCSYAPICTNEMMYSPPPSVAGLTELASSEQACLVECDQVTGHYLSRLLIYRGGVAATDVPDRFVPTWQRKYKYRFCIKQSPPTVVPNTGFSRAPISIASISNHTGLQKLFRGLKNNFELYRNHFSGKELKKFDKANDCLKTMIENCVRGNELGSMFYD